MSISTTLLTTTCDISRNNPPSGSPVAEDVACQLIPAYAAAIGLATADRKPWTHSLLLNSTVDIRDSYGGKDAVWDLANADTVHIPSGGSTAYVVIFVEVIGLGTTSEHKRVYLDRQAPTWPDL